MKTLRLTLSLLFALLCVLPAVAQNSQENASQSGDKWSTYYYVNVPIEKVYPYRLGYVVAYRKRGAELGRLYIPLEWFVASAGKGELIKMGPSTEWPYLTLFYKEGKFDHVRLHVSESYAHLTWGNLPQGTNIDDKFKVEELKLEF